jgi:hypothetical protein
VTTYGSVTGNYGTQYYLTVTSPYGTTGGYGWYNSGQTAYATLNTGSIDHGNGTHHVFTNWSGNASGTNYVQSNGITMNSAKTAVANWKTQYSVTFTHTGLDATATGTVVTVNGSPKTYGDLPYVIWVDAGSSTTTYAYANVSSSTAGKRFILTGVSGPTSPITVTSPTTVIGNYKTQYKITFSQTGVGSDFTGTVVTVDLNGYGVAALPTDFWWDDGSSHSFAFGSPLTVNISRQYDWTSTSGLSTLQSDSLTVSGSGSVTGHYVVHTKYQVTFNQTGVGSDFTGTVVTVDTTDYGVGSLPVSFWWDSGSSHSFSFASPLNVNACKRYVWVSTTGLSTSQGDTITVSSSGSITGNYKTQYYLTMATDPPSITTPTGAGWYDAGSTATISTDAFIDIVVGSSRYRFNGWTTPDMSEIADPTRSPTTVLVDKCKTVTANYVTQYKVTFSQSGISSDFSGNVLTVDSVGYARGSLPKEFWWDSGSSHSFAYDSPLVVGATSKQYVWTSTTGLSTSQSASITITGSGTITGNYKTQYYLTVHIDPPGIATIPGQGWYDASAIATLTAPSVSGYNFTNWDVDGVSRGSGVNPIQVTMNAEHTATAHYVSSGEQIVVKINPLDSTVYPGDHVVFTSNVTGGTPPYTYQWYLDGNPVSGATSPTWTFVPTHSGVFYVYLKVMDAHHNNGTSATARVTVLAPPVGGYSISLAKSTLSLLVCYGTLLGMFIVAISLIRRKRR